jgi:mannose-6-phosphate isomerase-like protein (cupin superfamily)
VPAAHDLDTAGTHAEVVGHDLADRAVGLVVDRCGGDSDDEPASAPSAHLVSTSTWDHADLELLLDTHRADGRPRWHDRLVDRPVNLNAALDSIEETWSPLTVAVVNDYDARVARVEGTFQWHSHPETDEFFMVLSGELTIEMAEGDVHLGPNDVYVVPSGRGHRPSAPAGATILMIEPSETINTGDNPTDRTRDRRVATTPPD